MLKPLFLADSSGKSKQAAFTLVEVMLSVLILGIGLTVVANSYFFALKGINSTANTIGALNLAKGKIEELEVSSLTNLLSVSKSSESLTYASKKYDYRQEISEPGQTEDLDKNLSKACVYLSWQEQNADKDIVLSTYFIKKQ